MNLKTTCAKQNGFTLIELVIYTALVSLVISGVFSTYRDQLQSQVIQREVSEMQQNLRAGMALMEREIKMAGINPLGVAGIGIVTAEDHQIRFTMDFTGGAGDGFDNDKDGIIDEGQDGLDNNGDGLIDEQDEAEWFDGKTTAAGEDITYRLSNDGNGDGRNDGGICHLERESDGNTLVTALHIEALNFVYLDKDGNRLATPVGEEQRRLIRSVQVSLVGRSGESISHLEDNFKDTRSYTNQQGDEILQPQNDAFRRLMLNTEIKCRNLGL